MAEARVTRARKAWRLPLPPRQPRSACAHGKKMRPVGQRVSGQPDSGSGTEEGSGGVFGTTGTTALKQNPEQRQQQPNTVASAIWRSCRAAPRHSVCHAVDLPWQVDPVFEVDRGGGEVGGMVGRRRASAQSEEPALATSPELSPQSSFAECGWDDDEC